MGGKKDKSKEKRDAKTPAAKPKGSTARPVQPPPKKGSSKQQVRKTKESPQKKKKEPMNELDNRTAYTLFGADLPPPDNETGSLVRRSRKMDDGFTVPGILQNTTNKKRHDYLLTAKLGPTEFAVSETKTGSHYFLKVEASGMPWTGPKLKWFVDILRNARKVDPVFRTHFLELVDTGLQAGHYNFIITKLGGKNLVDLRVSGPPLGYGQPDQQFFTSSAYQLCCQTLQAIHDVHLCRFIHRDIQPKNFIVGLGSNASTVYIVGFSLADQYYPTPEKEGTGSPSQPCHGRLAKLPWLDHTFQSRSFHRGDTICRQHDLESWLYMCYYLFNSFCLPWKYWNKAVQQERQVYNYKNLLFTGTFDDKLEGYVPMNLMNTLREMVYRDCETLKYPIDYSAYGEVFHALQNTLPRPVEWDGPIRFQIPKKTAAESAPKVAGKETRLDPQAAKDSGQISVNQSTTNSIQATTAVQGLASNAQYVVSGEKEPPKPPPTGFLIEPKQNIMQAIRDAEIVARCRMENGQDDNSESSSSDDDSKQNSVNREASKPADENSVDQLQDKQ